MISLLLILLASMVYGLWKALQNGTLHTNREVEHLYARIAAQDKTIETLSAQNRVMLSEALPTANAVLNALRAAAAGEQS